MSERKGIITFQGNPLTLLGDEPGVGDKAPGFTVIANDLSPYEFAPDGGKIRIISSVPSLDTPVCSAQTRRFNVEAAALGGDVEILTISMDLPFAQARWCGAEGVDKVTTLSDHRNASFGTAYGTLIKELRLLSRAVFVVDGRGGIRHSQFVPEITNEPDYEAVLQCIKNLI